MTQDVELRVVIFREGDFWLAQGLEHDLGVQAEHLKDLIARWDLAVAQEAAQGDLSALPPALPYFQHLWPHRAGAFQPAPPSQTSAVRCAFALVA